jgi:hypothetical protein
MHSCPRCFSSDLRLDGNDERGRVVYACAACGRHSTVESLAWSQVIAFPVTSSCSLFGTTYSWVLRPNASQAS